MPDQPFEPLVNQEQQNPARKLSSWLDTIFRPVGRPLGAVLGGLASSIAPAKYEQLAGEKFQQAGEHLPRLALELAAAGSRRLPVKLAGLGDVLLRSSTEPGSDIGTGLGETAAFATAPLAGGLARRAIAPIAGAAERQFASPLGRLLARSAVQEPAGIAGGLVPFEAAGALEAYRRGQLKEHLESLGSPEHLIGTAAGVLPFEAARIPAGFRAFTGALVQKTPITDSVDLHRVHWMAGEVPRFRDFGSEESAKDFADEVRRTVGGEPTVEAAGSVPRQRVVFNMAFKPEQLQSGFGFTGVDLLNDPATSLRLAPDKEGFLDSKNLVGRLKNVLHPVEFESYEKAGLGEFLKDKKKVTAQEMQDWIGEHGPKVEVKVLSSQGQASAGATERANLEHQLDTIDPQWRALDVDYVEQNWTLEQKQLYHKWQDTDAEARSSFDPDVYRSISPKDADQTVVMVRVPRKTKLQDVETDAEWEKEKPLHIGSHFGPEDVNVLAWSRGIWEDVGGKRVFHVIEVQSDWAQRLKEDTEKLNARIKELGADEETFRVRRELIEKQRHPLLRDYNRLALKAAIDHAIKSGADSIAVSDAETAMMTEGHDLAARIGKEVERKPIEPNMDVFQWEAKRAEIRRRYPDEKRYTIEPQWISSTEAYAKVVDRDQYEVPQEPGMRLNYDRILPEIMRELTGDKGKRVVFGIHQNAIEEGSQEGDLAGPTPRSNLIFKNPDNTPKTSSTGLSFDLTKAKHELEKRGGWSVFARDKIVREQVQRMDVEGYEPDEILRASENVKTLQPLKGEDALQTMARSVGIDPKLFARLGPGEALERAFDFFASVYHHNFGETPERAAYLARQTMTPLARFAPYLKQTAFAVAPAQEGASHLFTVPRPLSEMATYLTSLADLPKATKGTVSTDSMVFEMARMAGHEAAHNMGTEVLSPTGAATPQQRQSWIKAMASVEAIPPQERAKVMQNVMQLMVPPSKYNEVSKINMDRYATEPEEFLADFAAMISVGSLNGKTKNNLQDLMQFGDRASQDFGQAVYRDLTSMWGMVRDWMRVSMGYKPDMQAKSIMKRVDDVYKNLTDLMASHNEAERTFATFNAYMDRTSLGPLEPPTTVSAAQMHKLFRELDDINAYAAFATGKKVETSQQDMKLFDELLSYVRPYESSERAAGEHLTFWRDTFKPMVQLVESLKDKVPSSIPVYDLGNSYRGQVSDAQTAAWKLWQTTDAEKTEHPLATRLSGGIDWKRLRWLSKDGTPQERAFNKLMLAHNQRQQEENNGEIMTRKEKEKLSSEYKGLSDEDKNRMDQSVEQAFAINKLMAKRLWDSHKDRVVWGMTKVLMSHNKNMFHDRAYELAKGAVDLYFDEPVGATPDVQIAFAQKRVNFMESLPMSDDAKAMFVKAIEANRKPWLDLGDKLLGPVGQDGLRPGRNYMPEVRTREWHVNWKMALEDQPHHEAFNTEAEAVAKKRALEKQPDLEYIKTFNRKDRAERFRGMVQEEISSVQQDALDALKKTVLSAISREHPEAEDIVKQIDQEFQPATAFANIAVSPYMRKREFIPGRENLNMAEVLKRYVDAVSYQMAKRHVKQAGIAVLFNPDMRSNTAIRNDFENYLRFVTDAEGREFDLFKNLIFTNYIALNPSTMMVEPTQQLVTLVPYLVEHGMGARDAYKMLREVNRDLLKINLTKEGKLSNKWEQKALEEAENARVIDTGFTADLHGEGDIDFAGTRSSIMGNDAISEKVDLMKCALYQMLAVGRKSYGWVTTANGRVALISAFRQGWNQSKAPTEEGKYNEAYGFARQATSATMFGGGRANRPIALQRWGKLSGIGGVMYTLQSYTLNTMAMMARLTRKAITSSVKDPAEREAAMKAAGIMWATQFALGGILGLPLVASVAAVLEQIFPGLDVRKAMREGLVGLAGDDEDMGHLVADGSTRGLLNLSSVDFGSRFQLGNFLGVSPYDGFSWRNLAGPGATMLENWKNGVSQASEGRWGDAVRTAAPVSVKNVLNLVHDDWAIRDKAGRLIAELTPVEQGLAAIGFKPKKLAQYYEQQSIMERSENRKAREVRDLRSEIAKLIKEGDVASARQRIIEGMQEVGPYDPLDMAREAAQLAQEMTTPTPIPAGSRANMAEQSDIARLYPRGTTQSEQQRVLRQAAIMRELGATTGRPDIRAIRVAALVDQYLRQNPRANVVQARAAVERLLSPTARRREARFVGGY